MRNVLVALQLLLLLTAVPSTAAPGDVADSGCFEQSLVATGATVRDALRAATAGREVVGFGESVHGGHEFHQLLFDFALDLAQREPIELALEIDATHAAALDRWLQGANDPPLAELFSTRWWSSEIFYDETLRSFLVAARALDPKLRGRLRFAGYDLKQPQLAAAEIVATIGAVDRTRGEEIRQLSDRILALGGFGVFPNVAGFSATLRLIAPPRDKDTASPVLVVPLAGAGGTYGEAGIVVRPAGGDWSTRKVQSLPVTTLRAGATLLEVPLPTGAAEVELTLFHRGDGEVRFRLPHANASGEPIDLPGWESLRLAPLAMPQLQKQDYRHRIELDESGVAELVVAPDSAIAAAIAAERRIAQLVDQELAAGRLGAEERQALARAARSLAQALAWRTLEEPDRDRLLADNVLALAEANRSSRRLLLLAHASHIERIEGRMGGRLAATLGESYQPVTLLASSGSYRYFGDPRTTPAGAPLVDYPVKPDPWFDWIPAAATDSLVIDVKRARACAGAALTRAGVQSGRADLLVVVPRLRPIESARDAGP